MKYFKINTYHTMQYFNIIPTFIHMRAFNIIKNAEIKKIYFKYFNILIKIKVNIKTLETKKS